MKKILNIIVMTFIVSILLVPYSVFADEIDLTKYKSMSLEEVLTDEKISYDFSNYKENDNQVTIYLFRGKGCSHCYEFLQYVSNTLIKEYGDYFNLVTYEVWYDSANADLMTQVAEFMGDDAGGVPYIIIGDKTFIGYSESMNSEIESTIKKLYDSENRYDVFIEMSKASQKEGIKTSSNTVAIVIWNIIVTTIGVIIIVCVNNRNKNKILEEIQLLKSSKTKKGN